MTRALLLSMPDTTIEWGKHHMVGPWLGGTSIAANCPDHEVYVGDLVLKRNDVRGAIDEAVSRTNPQTVGLSALTFQFPTAVKVAKYIKEKYGLPIGAGGYHVTPERRNIAEGPEGRYFDYLFSGEGEKTYNAFLNCLESGKESNLSEIPGFSYKIDGRWHHNGQHVSAIVDPGLDKIIPPKREARLWDGFHFVGIPTDSVEGSRSCNSNCKICAIRSMFGEVKHAYFDPERVIWDIKRLKESGKKGVYLTDDNPAMDPPIFANFLERIIKEGLNDRSFAITSSTARMSERYLTDLMKRAGYTFCYLGVENIVASNLKEMKKGSNERLAAESLSNLEKSGITALAGLVVGNPGDTETTIRENFRWFEHHYHDALVAFYLLPLPGTPMREELLKEGLVVNRGGLGGSESDWGRYDGRQAIIKTRDGMMPEDIEMIVEEERAKYEKNRLRRIHKLNFVRNNPRHTFRGYLIGEGIDRIKETIAQRGMPLKERIAWKKRQRKAFNTFNI